MLKSLGGEYVKEGIKNVLLGTVVFVVGFSIILLLLTSSDIEG